VLPYAVPATELIDGANAARRTIGPTDNHTLFVRRYALSIE